MTALGEIQSELVGDEGRDEAARVCESADPDQCRRGPSDGGTTDPAVPPSCEGVLCERVVGELGQHRGSELRGTSSHGLVVGCCVTQKLVEAHGGVLSGAGGCGAPRPSRRATSWKR